MLQRATPSGHGLLGISCYKEVFGERGEFGAGLQIREEKLELPVVNLLVDKKRILKG